MSQTDLNVANASGAAVRTDINAHLDALASQSSGATTPTTTFPNQWWLDTSTNILKQRDNANTAWVNTASKAGTNWIPYLNGVLMNTVATESLAGIAEIATLAETDAGTDDTRIVSPLKLASTSVLLSRSYLVGLTLSNDTDATNDINVTEGAARNATNDGNLVLAAEQTKQLDVSWATGDDAGGLSSSLTLTNDTWYHAFLILVSGTVEVGFDTSIVAANLITDHSATKYRRIGSVRRGTATNLAFTQTGDRFLLANPTLDVDSTTLIATAVLYTLTVPTDLKIEAIINIGVVDSGGTSIYVSSPDADDEAASETAGPLASIRATSSLSAQSKMTVLTDTSSRVRARAEATADNFRIATLGWIDRRGRDD